MHPSAMANGKRFFDVYVAPLGEVMIADIGSQDVNGSLRQVAPSQVKYVGVDFQDGPGVDITITDPYRLPFDDESVDVLVSSSCLEHSEMFWIVFLDMLRVLKPNGLCYINVPSNGVFHRYPVDCWRFYPDAGKALINWAIRSGYNPALLEAFTSRQSHHFLEESGEGDWNDYVAIYVKDAGCAANHRGRITASFHDFENGTILGKTTFTNYCARPEDRRNQDRIAALLNRVAQISLYKAISIAKRLGPRVK